MALPQFSCDLVKSIKCFDSVKTVNRTFSDDFNQDYFSTATHDCCQIENLTECFKNNPAYDDADFENLKDLFIDGTNDGRFHVVEFAETWKRRIREVQVSFKLNYSIYYT